VAGSMAATIAAGCIAVGLPALLRFSSHSVKRTFQTVTGLKCPRAARGRLTARSSSALVVFTAAIGMVICAAGAAFILR
jgi:hypothetical protein